MSRNVQRRRIILYLPSLTGGGAERVFVNLACGFRDRGHDVALLLDQAQGDYLEQARRHGLTVHDLGAERTLSALPRLRAWFAARPADVLLSGLIANNLNAAALKLCPEGRTMRVVISDHTVISQQLRLATGRWRAPLFRQALRMMYPRADEVITVSHGVATDLMTLAPGLRRPPVVISNPVLPDDFAALYQQPMDRPDLANLQRPVILGVGRLHAQKGFDLLITAFARMAARQRGTLVILGQGAEEASLRALAESLGIGRRVIFAGFTDNVYPWYRWADLFALTSRWEGFGNVLIEAMGAGTPVVSVNCPSGPSEILANGKYGVLIPQDDPALLSDALSYGLAMTINQRAAARKRATEFCIGRVSARYLDVLLPAARQPVNQNAHIPVTALNRRFAINHFDIA
jgi:glycosyltransferase involved in cell wall biosynthesis